MLLQRSPHRVLRMKVATMEGLGGWHAQQQRIDDASQPVATRGLVAIDVVGKTIAARTFDAFSPKVTLHHQPVKPEKMQFAFAHKLAREVPGLSR